MGRLRYSGWAISLSLWGCHRRQRKCFCGRVFQPRAAVRGGCDHGTHVATIAAGDDGSLRGVARDADIIRVQVFSKFTSRYWCGGYAPCVMSSAVVSVQEDSVAQPMLKDSTDVIQADQVWNMTPTLRGKGQAIAVLDTGTNHERMLKGRIVAGGCFSSNIDAHKRSVA